MPTFIVTAKTGDRDNPRIQELRRDACPSEREDRPHRAHCQPDDHPHHLAHLAMPAPSTGRPVTIARISNRAQREHLGALYRQAFPVEQHPNVGPRLLADDIEAERVLARLFPGRKTPPVVTHLGAYINGRLVGGVTSEMDLPSVVHIMAGELEAASPGIALELTWESRCLAWIAVDPEHQHQGIATQLLASIEAADAAAGITRWCGVATSDPAIRLLRRHGYTVHNRKMPAGGHVMQFETARFILPIDQPGGKGFHKQLGAKVNPLTGYQR